MSVKGDRHWTGTQVSILTDNYGKLPIKELCKMLNRRYQAVTSKARQLGLTKKFPLQGALNGNWKGGYTCIGAGYLKNNKTEKLLHREIVEEVIRRELRPEEIVHHIDGDRSNNSVENLFICGDMSQHRQLHWSLEKLAMELVRKDGIRFDRMTKRYYLVISGY